MVIISQKAIHDFATKYPLAADPLNRWCKVASQANWRNFLEVKESFNATDYIGNDRYVFLTLEETSQVSGHGSF